MRDVGDHGLLVDRDARADVVAFVVHGDHFPEKFAWIGNDAGTDSEVFDRAFDDTSREEVELETAGGMAGVGAAVDFDDDVDGGLQPCGIAEFFDDFGDEAAFAFIAHGDAAVSDEFAFEFGESHLRNCRMKLVGRPLFRHGSSGMWRVMSGSSSKSFRRGEMV